MTRLRYDHILAGTAFALIADDEAAQLDALDEEAVEDHLGTVVERAGGVDISFNAIGPGPAPERTPLTELAAELSAGDLRGDVIAL